MVKKDNLVQRLISKSQERNSVFATDLNELRCLLEESADELMHQQNETLRWKAECLGVWPVPVEGYKELARKNKELDEKVQKLEKDNLELVDEIIPLKAERALQNAGKEFKKFTLSRKAMDSAVASLISERAKKEQEFTEKYGLLTLELGEDYADMISTRYDLLKHQPSAILIKETDGQFTGGFYTETWKLGKEIFFFDIQWDKGEKEFFGLKVYEKK